MQSFISFCQWLWSFIGGFGGLVGVASGVCGVIALFQTGSLFLPCMEHIKHKWCRLFRQIYLTAEHNFSVNLSDF